MQRPGTDPANVEMSDILCDFCGAEWVETLPMVEGHHGACICGNCLKEAYRDVVLQKRSVGQIAGMKCTMCLEEREEAHWTNASHAEAHICKRCINQSAGVLHKDADFAWSKPTS
ncbi:MAG TPA: ClpX C4-type zinc finger protein [Phycisphaerales bacterium]|nr:ClpX C4-type zinc finger protein [Phycisphaerales bacterium]